MFVAGVAMLVLALVAVVMVLVSAGLRDESEQESEEEAESTDRPGRMPGPDRPETDHNSVSTAWSARLAR
jgi:hypothetical protein